MHNPNRNGNESKWLRRRNLLGFWFLGLCNNFAYVIMLSAAHDILLQQENSTMHESHSQTIATDETTGSQDNETQYLECSKISTGAILLADILPTLCIKFTAPFYIQKISYRIKVLAVIAFALISFLLVAFSQGIMMSILGVIFASCCGGLGEVTFLSLSTFYHKNVVSAYASGTGGAGLFGALSYAGLTSAGLSPKTTVLVMVIIPLIMACSYFCVLGKPASAITGRQEDEVGLLSNSSTVRRGHTLTIKHKLLLIIPLLKFMIPLTLVYFAEYFINQGLHELLYFDNIWLTKSEQYRWYQVDYQLGVLISRSSVNLFEIRRLWILPILQLLNMALLIGQVFFQFIPNIWIILAIVLYEGLLGGASFVNTFFRISAEVEPEHREYSMGVATISDTFGIAVAGAVAIPSHNHICNLNLKLQ
ncbi:hypothetical protein ScPMuIL_009341 [Solemya velum]